MVPALRRPNSIPPLSFPRFPCSFSPAPRPLYLSPWLFRCGPLFYADPFIPSLLVDLLFRLLSAACLSLRARRDSASRSSTSSRPHSPSLTWSSSFGDTSVSSNASFVPSPPRSTFRALRFLRRGRSWPRHSSLLGPASRALRYLKIRCRRT